MDARPSSSPPGPSRREFLAQSAAAAAALSWSGWIGTPTGAAAEAERPAIQGRIKQSLCWGCFARGLEPEQLIREAAAIGYRSIEMGPREHWGRIREAGMDVAIFVGHGSLADGLNDPQNHDRIERELLANLEVAVEYGIPSLLCLSGNRRGRSDAEGLDQAAACLSRVVPAAEEKNVTLCVELLNSKVDHPDYMCDHTAWGVELCQRLNSPAVKLVYDIYHMQIMEGDLIRTIRQNLPCIGHFHTAGNPGRSDPDETQEIYYPAVMRALADGGYPGYVGHEFSPKGDCLEAMKKTFPVFDV